VTEISVIVSTYNRPTYLERVLRGYAVQTDPAFELVIADDGSGPETFDLIARTRSETQLSILHVWHEDRGFRKSLILNRAIEAVRGDYLLFTDGDCVPRRDLIEVHRRIARPGRYVSGGYLKLPPHVTSTIELPDVDSGRITELNWLRSRGWKPGRRALRMIRSQKVAALFDFMTPTAADFQGNNASTSRDALYLVNGFETEMGYGGLDQALGYRLQNAGVMGIQARHRAVTMHLHHDRPYRDATVVKQNREIMSRIRNNREIRARRGLSELEPDPTLRIER
jgi:glycosyltransferase involved in cell wall biosynthesis